MSLRAYNWPVFSEEITIIHNNNNNLIQFFIIYVPSQQLQGKLQTQHSVDTSNYIMGKHNIKSKSS
jgi:hypothetical protein